MPMPALTRFAMFVLCGACFSRMLHAEWEWAVADMVVLVCCFRAHDWLHWREIT